MPPLFGASALLVVFYSFVRELVLAHTLEATPFSKQNRNQSFSELLSRHGFSNWGGGEGQLQAKDCSLPRFAFHGNDSAVLLHDPLGNG